MVEWRSATVDRIMSLRPRRVLEIGAGSGLLLSQIAPQCDHYVATDFSAIAIDNLARSMERLQLPWRDRVELLTLPAHVTDGLSRGDFDTIISWSVETWGGHPDLSFFLDSWHSQFVSPPGKVQTPRNWQP